jgi:hypothetical protein
LKIFFNFSVAGDIIVITGHQRMEKTLTLRLTFRENLSVLIPHPEQLIQLSEVISMLIHRGECVLVMKEFDYNACRELLNAIYNKTRVSFRNVLCILDICAFLLIKDHCMMSILPDIQPGMVQHYLGVVHKLLISGYQNVAKIVFTNARIPLFLLDDINISYKKFKRKFRNASRLNEFIWKKCVPTCLCRKCQTFRHERLLQLGGEDDQCYPTPFWGTFKKPWLSTVNQ